MSLTKNFVKAVSAVLLIACTLAAFAACGKKDTEPAVTTGTESDTVTVTVTDESTSEVTTVEDGTATAPVTDEADPDTTAVTDTEDEPVIVTTQTKEDPEPVITEAKDEPEPPVTTEAKDEPEPPFTTEAKDEPEPPVTTEAKDEPVADPASAVKEIAVGIGTKSMVYRPGDEEYEYILSAIKKRGDGQIFAVLAYDYESMDELTRSAYYVELRFAEPLTFIAQEHGGEMEFPPCREVLFLLTGELNRCFVVDGRAPMYGLKQDIALAEYVQKLLK